MHTSITDLLNLKMIQFARVYRSIAKVLERRSQK